MALTPKATRSRRWRRRAVEYFKVGAERRTPARAGILLYLSLDERRAEIVADEAIHGKVAAERWGDAMAALVDEVRADKTGEGVAAAVENGRATCRERVGAEVKISAARDTITKKKHRMNRKQINT